jgi:hypothetical protein
MLRLLGLVLAAAGAFVLLAPRLLPGFTLFSDYGFVAPAIAAAAVLIGIFLVWSGGWD